jgi:hypothetical protein
MSYAGWTSTREIQEERDLLSALMWEGPQGVATLMRTPFTTSWFTGQRRLAADALIEACSQPDAAAPILPETVAALVRPLNLLSANEIEIELRECATSTSPGPGAVERLTSALADKRSRESATATTSRTKLLEVADIFAPLPPVKWLCEALGMAPGAPTVFGGYGYSGKTVCVQDMALAVALGTVAWGRFPVRAGRVLHLDYEQGSHLTRLRYQRLALARGIEPAEFGGRLQLASMPAWYLDADAGDELSRLCEGVDLVIVDSFKAACPHTEENSSEARIPLDRFGRLSETTGVTPVVIHHARKPSQNAQGGARMSLRGSGALYDALGSLLVFSGEKGEPITVEHEKNRITGKTHPTFRVQVEDVEIDGDPSGGLRVTALDVPPSQPKASGDRFAGVKARVLELIREQGPIAGANAVLAHLGGRKGDILTAVAELEQSGAILRGGDRTHPTLTAVGTAP